MNHELSHVGSKPQRLWVITKPQLMKTEINHNQPLTYSMVPTDYQTPHKHFTIWKSMNSKCFDKKINKNVIAYAQKCLVF